MHLSYLEILGAGLLKNAIRGIGVVFGDEIANFILGDKASKEIKELVGTKCIYAINFFKSTSFTNTKCKVSDIGFEKLQFIKQ